MTDEQIRELGPAFSAYLRPYFEFCNQKRTAAHLGDYCRALLSDAPRKTAEPNALAAGAAVRTLQKFLTTTQWDHESLRDLLQARMAETLGGLPTDGLGTVGVIDETSCVKKGKMTPGVQRQYLGCVGKIENGIVTVHLAATRGKFRTLLDADLFLPKSWDADRKRCRQVGIPDSVTYRPKWRIALEQYARAMDNGVSFDWLTFDEGYGGKPLFLVSLALVGQKFAGEVPKSFAVDGKGSSSRRADEILPESKVRRGKRVRLTRETVADQVWRAVGKRVTVNGLPMLLVAARNAATGEVKYFAANGTTSVRKALKVGFRRWTVEHLFRVTKQEVGLMHFEGRKYTGLMRHLILSLLTLGFVAIQTDRLREKKSGGDDGASLPGVERALQGLADAAAGDLGPETRRRSDPLPPSPQRQGQKLTPQTAA